MEYIKEPWVAKEIPPRIFHEVASHRIKDAYGTLIASIKAPYIPAPDTLTIEAHLNLWRNTARIIKYAPDMYTLLRKLQNALSFDDPNRLEIVALMDKVEGTCTELDVMLQRLREGGKDAS